MTTGPIPKRTDQRRRRNQPDVPVSTGAARPAVMPEPDEAWHPLASAWYVSLSESGQSDYYQASDWATARVWTEVLSRQLNSDERLSAALVAAWASGATALLSTEGDRRRMRLELERKAARPSGTDEVEDELDAHRARRSGQSAGHHAGGSA